MLPKNLRFLIVDDNAMGRQLIENALSELGYPSPDSAAGGGEALNKIGTAKTVSPYDVVFLDWQMPDMDGYEVLKACRMDEGLDRMAIVMVTAESEKNNILKAVKAGVTGYLIKPVKLAGLARQLDNLSGWWEKRIGK